MDEPLAERGFTSRRRKASSNQTHSFIVTVPERESNATYMIEKMEKLILRNDNDNIMLDE